MLATHEPDQAEHEPDAKDVEVLLDEALEHIVGGLGVLPATDDETRHAHDDDVDKPLKFI